MSGGTRIAGVDFPEDLTRSIVFVASRRDRFWCDTGAACRPPATQRRDCEHNRKSFYLHKRSKERGGDGGTRYAP
jgi:hypothetical protein